MKKEIDNTMWINCTYHKVNIIVDVLERRVYEIEMLEEEE